MKYLPFSGVTRASLNAFGLKNLKTRPHPDLAPVLVVETRMTKHEVYVTSSQVREDIDVKVKAGDP